MKNRRLSKDEKELIEMIRFFQDNWWRIEDRKSFDYTIKQMIDEMLYKNFPV